MTEFLQLRRSYLGVTAVYACAPDDHHGTRAAGVVMPAVRDGKFTLAGK